MISKPKSLGILVARLIVGGDVHGARLAAGGRRSWTVPEVRAIAGACRLARQRYGAPVGLADFT